MWNFHTQGAFDIDDPSKEKDAGFTQTNRARNHAFWSDPILWNSQFVEHLSSKSKMMLKYLRSLIFELFFYNKKTLSLCIGWYVTCFTKDHHIRICTFISHQSDRRIVVFFFISDQSHHSIWISCTNYSVGVLISC